MLDGSIRSAWSPLVPQALEHGKDPYRNPQTESEDARPDDGISRAGRAMSFQRVGISRTGTTLAACQANMPSTCRGDACPAGLQLAHRTAGLDVHPPSASLKLHDGHETESAGENH